MLALERRCYQILLLHHWRQQPSWSRPCIYYILYIIYHIILYYNTHQRDLIPQQKRPDTVQKRPIKTIPCSPFTQQKRPDTVQKRPIKTIPCSPSTQQKRPDTVQKRPNNTAQETYQNNTLFTVHTAARGSSSLSASNAFSDTPRPAPPAPSVIPAAHRILGSALARNRAPHIASFRWKEA